MNTHERIDRLYFHHNRVVHQQVDPEPAFQDNAPVAYRKRQLAAKRNPGERQLVREAGCICTFKQPGAKFFVNPHGTADDLPAQPPGRPFFVLFVLFVVQDFGIRFSIDFTKRSKR